MTRTILRVVFYTLLNIRYASLILPCGVTAYLLQFYALAVTAGILLVAAFAAEVALSIANGVEAHKAIESAKHWEAREEEYLAEALTKLEHHANDWTDINGSQGEAGPSEGEAPDEGGPVPSR